MKRIKIGLLPRILIAIVLGVIIGQVFPLGLVRVFETFNSIFSQFLGFCIPLIIVPWWRKRASGRGTGPVRPIS